MTDITARTRTITWQDPLAAAQQALTLSGLDYLQAMVDGRVPPPPIAVLMGFGPAEVAAGRVIFTVEPAEYHYNPIGVVHGGLISTLCDSALGCAIQTLLPAGTGYTTIELHVNFVRALTRDTGLIRCEANVLHVGRRLATAEAKVTDRAGKLYGHATTTCMVFPSNGDQ
jgi:uncharacterized protein (TIGR00369 family)